MRNFGAIPWVNGMRAETRSRSVIRLAPAQQQKTKRPGPESARDVVRADSPKCCSIPTSLPEDIRGSEANLQPTSRLRQPEKASLFPKAGKWHGGGGGAWHRGSTGLPALGFGPRMSDFERRIAGLVRFGGAERMSGRIGKGMQASAGVSEGCATLSDLTLSSVCCLFCRFDSC